MGDQAKIITFYSSKGGVGKSVLAINSAITYSKIFDKKTLLVDMDLKFGDIAMLLDKHTSKTIIDMIDDNHFNSYEEIKPYFHSHNDKLDILFAPKNPESSEYIERFMIEQIIDNVKNHYDMIIFDSGINFDDHTLYALDMSNYILFVTTMDILSLKNTKLGLSVMKSLNYDNNKVKLVLNGVNSKFGITEKDIHNAFPEKIFAKIPEDIKNMRKAVNLGIPLCEFKRATKVVRAIENMCEALLTY